MKKSILVVEDDLTMSQMLEYNLTHAGFSVDLALDGVTAIKRFLSNKEYQVVLMDIMLPSVNGFDVCRQIRKKSENTVILFVSARSEKEAKLTAFKMGADDYITKPFSIEELIARINANLKRIDSSESDGKPSELCFGDLKIDECSYMALVNGNDLGLSLKEFRLLSILANNLGKTLSRQKLMEEVWQYSHLGDSRTIDVHIKNLRKKLSKYSKYSFIHTARGIGYKFKLTPREERI